MKCRRKKIQGGEVGRKVKGERLRLEEDQVCYLRVMGSDTIIVKQLKNEKLHNFHSSSYKCIYIYIYM